MAAMQSSDLEQIADIDAAIMSPAWRLDRRKLRPKTRRERASSGGNSRRLLLCQRHITAGDRRRGSPRGGRDRWRAPSPLAHREGQP